MRSALHQLQLIAHFAQHVRADAGFDLRIVERFEDRRILAGKIAARFVQVYFAGDQMDHAFQAITHADGPGHRRALDAEHRFDLVEQVDRVLALAVKLVDEGHDRGVAQAAHLHQLDRAFLHALCDVDHHQRGVDRGQHAVGVFAEVGVAWGVEQVDDATLVGELHHRTGDRPPNSRSFSVSVVLPASGWEMMAKVRRRAASSATCGFRAADMGVLRGCAAVGSGGSAIIAAPPLTHRLLRFSASALPRRACGTGSTPGACRG